MSSVFQRLRKSISNRWNRKSSSPKSPSSIADFPESIELLAGENESHQLVVSPKRDPPEFNEESAEQQTPTKDSRATTEKNDPDQEGVDDEVFFYSSGHQNDEHDQNGDDVESPMAPGEVLDTSLSPQLNKEKLLKKDDPPCIPQFNDNEDRSSFHSFVQDERKPHEEESLKTNLVKEEEGAGDSQNLMVSPKRDPLEFNKESAEQQTPTKGATKSDPDQEGVDDEVFFYSSQHQNDEHDQNEADVESPMAPGEVLDTSLSPQLNKEKLLKKDDPPCIPQFNDNEDRSSFHSFVQDERKPHEEESLKTNLVKEEEGAGDSQNLMVSPKRDPLEFNKESAEQQTPTKGATKSDPDQEGVDDEVFFYSSQHQNDEHGQNEADVKSPMAPNEVLDTTLSPQLNNEKLLKKDAPPCNLEHDHNDFHSLVEEEEGAGDSQQSREGRNLVSICKGRHEGKEGEIVDNYDKRTYRVRLLDNGEIVNVRVKSVVPKRQQQVPPKVDSHPTSNICPMKGKQWLGLQVRDRESGAVGMVEKVVDDQMVLLRLHEDDKEEFLRVPASQLSPSKEGTILPENMKVERSCENPKIQIVAGRHAYKVATLLGNGKRKDQVLVEINGNRLEVKRSSINIPLQEQKSMNVIESTSTKANPKTLSSSQPDLSTNASSDTSVNATVRISAGKHFGKLAIVLGDGPRKDLVRVSIDGEVCNVKRSSIEEDIAKTLVRPNNIAQKGRGRSTQRREVASDNLTSQQAAAWTLPDTSGANIMNFIGRRVLSITVDDNPNPEITMLNAIFGDRIFYVNQVLNGRCNQAPLPATAEHQGVRYELVSTRLKEDESGGRFSKKDVLVHGYVATAGPNVASLSLNDELLRIADFSRLPARKVASRLELFMSPARFSIYFAREEDFCQIPETGNVGCGFISEEKLLEICRDGNMTRAAASRVVAIQVRIFLPCMGIFKGMLVKKLNTASPIELPPSMMKVPASTHENAWKGAAIVVCKNGVHPSPGSANEYIGRALDDSRKNPPTKSFEQKIQKELKAMILRLWISMGVPKGICRDYMKQSVKTDRRNHAWLVGVADPTGNLPYDSVFVPGMKSFRREHLFVTRSPCVKYEDGRILDHICEQPSEMSNEAWEWLNGLSFGCIVFSNPRENMMSVPERIAIGDLDGDLYLVCWDAEILSNMESSPLPVIKQEDDGVLSTVPSDCDWLQSAQDLLHDVGSLNRMKKLIGKLYTLGEKFSDTSLGLKDADAAAFFDAYNQALEYKKHGRPILLPQHLHDKVPKELRSLLDVRLPEDG